MLFRSTPLGDESLWETSAILGAEEPPFASAAQDGETQDAQDDDAGLADDDAASEDSASGAEDADDADVDAVEGEGRSA